MRSSPILSQVFSAALLLSLLSIPRVAAADPILVACAGDSITQGIGTPQAPDKSFPRGYPAQLAEILGEGYAVTNFGAGGRTLLRKADPYGYGRPLRCGAKIAVICLGTNDSKPYAWDAHGAEFEADYIHMVEEFKAQPSFEAIYLCLPPPVFHGGQWGIREEILASGIRPAVRRVARATGCRIIDLATPLADDAALFPDRVHPNAEGARKLAEVVADAIRRGGDDPGEDGAADDAAATTLLVPKAAVAPVIDGDISDAAWASAAAIDGLLPPSNEPRDGEPAPPEPHPTRVLALWENDALCVAFACVDPEVVSTGTMRHDDDLYNEDVVEVFVDPAGDGRAFLEAEVSPDGVTLDLLHLYTAEPEALPDGRVRSEILKRDRWSIREWEHPGLEAAAKRTADGWQAEIRIPLAPLLRRLDRKTLAPGQTLRAQFIRYDHDGGAFLQQSWRPCLLGNVHNSPSLFGTLLLQP